MAVSMEDVEFGEELFKTLNDLFDGIPQFQILMVCSRIIAKIAKTNDHKPDEVLKHVREVMMMEMIYGDRN